MIKATLYGMDKIITNMDKELCVLHLGIPYSNKKVNAIGIDYCTGMAWEDKAQTIYDKIIKDKLIGENVILGGMMVDYHKCTIHDIEKAK